MQQTNVAFGSAARSVTLLTTGLTAVFFMQLYSNNLLLSIVRPAAITTPDTLQEVVTALEDGSLRLAFPTNTVLAGRKLLEESMNANAL